MWAVMALLLVIGLGLGVHAVLGHRRSRDEGVYLRTLAGSSPEEIAADFGMPVKAAEQAITRQSARAASIRGVPIVEPEPLGSRPELAQEILDSDDLPEVAVGDNLMGDSDAGFWFSDVLCHEFSDLVDETVSVVLAVAKVERAFREDREFIAVYGRGIDPHHLQEVVQGWWRRKLQLIACSPEA